MIRSAIVATGSHIPSVRVPNAQFLNHDFRGTDQKPISKSNADIIQQFEAITGIRERRYVPDDLVTTDIAYEAARDALDSSNIDPETLDGIIVAHNFGDVRAGDNQRVMIIGADTLSRISDPHDRDSLIYADGAGAVIVEKSDDGDHGILARAVRSDTLEHADLLYMGTSYNPEVFLEALFLKMEGRKLYKYALNTVAGAIRDAMQRASVGIADVKKVLIHQANGKMDEAILGAMYELYGIDTPPDGVMPMTISWLGNSSVATVPTLLDLILKGKLDGHIISRGDVVVFASVGAGMHINAVVYRF